MDGWIEGKLDDAGGVRDSAVGRRSSWPSDWIDKCLCNVVKKSFETDICFDFDLTVNLKSLALVEFRPNVFDLILIST